MYIQKRIKFNRGVVPALLSIVCGVLLNVPHAQATTLVDPGIDVTPFLVPPNEQSLTVDINPPDVFVTSSTSEFQFVFNPSSCTQPTNPWPAAAAAAFEAAGNIWAAQLHSVVPIVVEACWRPLASNVLGSAGGPHTRDWAGTPTGSTWYPRSLAHALQRVDGNGPTAEINANFNSNFANWYFGTDGVTPSNQFDFVSVVLHEMGHGLGVAGFMRYGGNLGDGVGQYGLGSGLPNQWDRLAKDGNGNLLTSIANTSTALGTAITGGTGGGVFLHGSSGIAANGGPVQLYTPSVWRQGSSYSHFGQSFNGGPDSLMTFSIGTGQSEHVLGPVTLAVMKDVGWPEDNDANVGRAISVVGFVPGGGILGSLTTDFTFTNNGSENLQNFYLLVNTANNATMGNADITTNGGGVDSIREVANSALPGSDGLLQNGEALTIRLVTDITAAPFNLNFDVVASDQLIASKTTSPNVIASFSINQTILQQAGIEFDGINTATSIDTDSNLSLAASGGTSGIGAIGGRSDLLLPGLLILALLCFTRRRLR